MILHILLLSPSIAGEARTLDGERIDMDAPTLRVFWSMEDPGAPALLARAQAMQASGLPVLVVNTDPAGTGSSLRPYLRRHGVELPILAGCRARTVRDMLRRNSRPRNDMGRLRSTDGRSHRLTAHTLVGRGPLANLRIDSRLVSAEHAILTWRTDAWVLRDAGSRNGTSVNDTPLGPGDTRLLAAGETIGFGGEIWVVEDVSPPVAVAIAPDGTEVVGQPDLLMLPEDAPTHCVYASEDGWRVEVDGEVQTLGATLLIAGVEWHLELPTTTRETWNRDDALTLAAVNLRFEVSRDQEFVQLFADLPGARVDLGARSHHHLLLLLARARAGDRSAPEPTQGWMYVDEVSAALRLDERMLNLHVHRARRQLAQEGIRASVHVVERRPSTRQLRLGVSSVVIHEIGAPT